MIGRTPGYIVAVRPMRQGAITDFDITERMLQVLLRRVGRGPPQPAQGAHLRPLGHHRRRAPSGKEAARRAGASASYLIEQPMAAAIGAGLAIHEPVGSMVVDVGGGTSEMAVISLGGVVALRAIRCGGFDLDAAIQTYVRTVHGVAIGERTAEAVKLAIGSAHPYEGEQQAEIRGREVIDRACPRPCVLDARPRSGAPSRTTSPRSSPPPPRAWATPRRSWRRTSSSRASTWSAGGRCCAA